MVIVTGCERSGTTIIGQELARYYGIEYVHEEWPTNGETDVVMKHSLNMNQGRKHLEYLDFMYPNALWYYVIRDGREVVRSMVQKVWKRKPRTMSLDQGIDQWNHILRTTFGFVNRKGIIIRYECPEWYEGLTYDSKSMWRDYFTNDQKQYLNRYLKEWLMKLDYNA